MSPKIPREHPAPAATPFTAVMSGISKFLRSIKKG